MTVAPGTQLGPYEIVAPLGAGGMGEVYRARDTRLGRDVAVKLLSAHLSAWPEARQRFEREARAISQLTHPHICTLYDVGSDNGAEYLVMELLEGETLAKRLTRGALSLDQALRYGQEIAAALDQAHRQGIVHRDLKPANVMLTKSGVKLLDFGLAKVLSPPAPSPASLDSDTSLPTQANLTEAGRVPGTFQYMAPELFEGREADARTDIFALGGVLYEMTTGARAFEGGTRAALISAILRDEPRPVSERQPMAPAPLDRIVRKCLAKDPEDRWQSARDVASELEWIRGSGSGEVFGAARRPRRAGAPWILSGALAAALAAIAFLVSRSPGAPPMGAIRFQVLPAESSRLSVPGVTATSFALSPDGRRVAFCATSPSAAAAWNGSQIFVRAFDAPVPVAVEGTEGAYSPFWSPDGASLAFFADNKLKKVALSGGSPVTICDNLRAGSGTWGRGGTIVFSEWGSTTLEKVSAGGGKPVAATRLDASRKERWHEWPVFLPDGKHFLYLSQAGDEWPRAERGVYAASVDSLDARLVARVESEFAFASPGLLLFSRDGALLALRFDAARLATRGEPISLAPEVAGYGPTGAAQLSGSPGAAMIAYAGGGPLGRLVWVDRVGRELASIRTPDYYSTPRLSPDGKRLAFALVDRRFGTNDVWVQDLERDTASRVNFGPASESQPIWAPDGRRLFFSADPGGKPPELFQVDLNDMKSVLLTSGPGAKLAGDVSPDGRYLAYRLFSGDAGGIEVLPLGGEGKPFALLPRGAGGDEPRFSPDGRFVAYSSDESGKPEVYVRPLDGSGEHWQVSRSGGATPVWSVDGRELYFLDNDTLMAAPVRLERGFDAGIPKALFTADFHVGFGGSRSYDVGRDGRFLLLLNAPDARRRGIDVIAHWTPPAVQ